MLTTMPDFPLTVTQLFEHGAKIYHNSEVITSLGRQTNRISFKELSFRVKKLAAALHKLGVKQGDCVGTLCWNTQEHLETFFAVPSMGAILSPLNIRFSPEQLVYSINQTKTRIIIVHDSLVPALAGIRHNLTFIEHIIVVGGITDGSLKDVLIYEKLLAGEKAEYQFPDIDERTAASVCFTGGTTGQPKGVVYSHRSEYLHSITENSAAGFGLSERDRVLLITPMFHANAWGMPYSAWVSGADLILPGRSMQPEDLCRLIETERPTYSGAAPIIWKSVLDYAEIHKYDMSSLREVICGGSATPRSLIEGFQEKLGVRMVQAWGMVETSSAGAISHPPKNTTAEDYQWRAKTGRIVPGFEFRLVHENKELMWDGKSIGEIQVRGAWITASYLNLVHLDDFQDGWLRTGDIGTIDPIGFIQITDRIKDVIKSGGEWISSVTLENCLISHQDISEAAVIAIPHEKWGERPLAFVVLKGRREISAAELKVFLENKVAHWWLPEDWAFIEEMPRTNMGKINKKLLREKYELGEFNLISLK